MNIFYPKVDLILSCGLDSDHGVSGHLFELIEYYYYFKFYKKINCCILIPFNFKIELFIKALSKYTFTSNEIGDIVKNTIIKSDIKVIKGNILFVDGFKSYFKNVIIDGKIYGFRCALNSGFNDGIIFQDTRIYSDYKSNSIHYIKKILFDKYKLINSHCDNNALIYATRNCRGLSEQYFNNFKFSNEKKFNKIYVVSEKPYPFLDPPFINIQPPIDNIFEIFETFIYTPINTNYCKEFDCSPRFPAECRFYNKKIIYDIPFIYNGLKVRLYDIDHHFDKLFLTKDDCLCELMRL